MLGRSAVECFEAEVAHRMSSQNLFVRCATEHLELEDRSTCSGSNDESRGGCSDLLGVC